MDETRLLDDLFAYVCERRVGDFIDTDRVLAAIDAAATEDRLARFHARFVAPAIARLLERANASQVTLGRWLPSPVVDALRAWLGKPVHVPRWVIDDIVESDAVRDEVRDLIQETVTDALRKGGGGGVFSWGARAARGFVPDQLQRGLEDRMRDLLSGAVAMAQRRIARRLASPEVARALGKRRRRLFRQVLERTEHDAARAIGELPIDLLHSLFAPVVAHNLARSEVRASLRLEIEHVLAELSKQTIGELLDEYGLREWARALVRERGAPWVRDFLEWRARRPT